MSEESCSCSVTKPKKKFIIRPCCDNKLSYGCTVNMDKIDNKELSSCKCLQTSLGPMERYKVESLQPYRKWLSEHLEKNKRSLYIHAPYVANLSNVDSDKREKSMVCIKQELEEIKDLPSSCVMHIGTRGKISNITESLNQLERQGYLKSKTERNPYPLLLEVAAGKGTELGKDWEELRIIYEGIDKCRIGLCLDTCHLFASGMCAFEKKEDIVKLFDNVESVTGHKVNLVHLNDSKETFKSNKDRHAPLSQGYIWYKKKSSLEDLIYRCIEGEIDIVGETSDPMADFELIRSFKIDKKF
jgi:deoxyribonuclease-4